MLTGGICLVLLGGVFGYLGARVMSSTGWQPKGIQIALVFLLIFLSGIAGGFGFVCVLSHYAPSTIAQRLAHFNRSDPVLSYDREKEIAVIRTTVPVWSQPVIHEIALRDWRARQRLVGKSRLYLYWDTGWGRNYNSQLVLVKYI